MLQFTIYENVLKIWGFSNRNLEYDDSEHYEKADSNDDGEGQEIRVDVEGFVIRQDDPNGRIDGVDEEFCDQSRVRRSDEDAGDQGRVVSAHRNDFVGVDVVDDHRWIVGSLRVANL